MEENSPFNKRGDYDDIFKTFISQIHEKLTAINIFLNRGNLILSRWGKLSTFSFFYKKYFE